MIFFPLLLLFIFCMFSIDVLATETKSEDLAIQEYVFLIDTSASMSWGKDHPECDHDPLAPKLEEEINKTINKIEKKESGKILDFYFYPFDEGIAQQEGNEIDFFSNSDTNYKDYIHAYLKNLKFKGKRTHICSSLESVINIHNAKKHSFTILLYTDGQENEKDKKGEIKWPLWDKFWEKIKSLLEGTEWKLKNNKLYIFTLEIEWPEPPEGIIVVTKYDISVTPDKLEFGNLYENGEKEAILSFNIPNKKISWQELNARYPDLTINATPQEFYPKMPTPTIGVISSKTDGEYNLTFRIDKAKMIADVISEDFTGELAIYVNSKELEEIGNSIGLIDNIPVSFSFTGLEKYRISTLPTELDFGDLYDTAEGKAVLAFNITTDTGNKVNWDKFLEKYPDLTVTIAPQGFNSNIIDYIEDISSIKLSSIKNGKYDTTFIVDKDKMIADEKFGEYDGELTFSLNEQSISMAPISIHFKFYRPEVEVLPVSLNFGSLEGDITRTISFDYNEKARQDKSSFIISIEPSEDNPSSLSIGKHVLINNQTTKEVTISAPTSYIDFQISLAQNELTPGNYEGKLSFKSDKLFINDENLEPDSKNSEIKYIPWTFTIPPPPEVRLEIGKLERLEQEGKLSYQQEIKCFFNRQAVDKKSNLLVSVEPSAKNPSPLDISCKDSIAPASETQFTLQMTPKESKYGKYSGKIYFTGDELQIEGENLKTDDPTNPNQKYYGWTFKTPIPLWMKILIWAIGLIILLVIAYLIYLWYSGKSPSLPSFKSSKAVIPDETYLYIRDYDTGKREQINISGKEEVVIGKGGQYLSDTEEKIVLRAIKEDGKNMARLTVESGKVILVKAGSTKEEIVVEQNVYNRDIIKFGNYQIRVSGFYLEKDIN